RPSGGSRISGSTLHDVGTPGLPGRDRLQPPRQYAPQQIVECTRRLQVPQPGGIGRGDVDAKIPGNVIKAVDALDVVGCAVKCVFVGADVDAHDPSRWVAEEPCQCRSVPAVVKPEP